MNEVGYDPKASRSKLAQKRAAKVSEKESAEKAHQARLHVLNEVCLIRDRWRTYQLGERIAGDLWNEIDDVLNEHFARVVSGNYDLTKGLPETLQLVVAEMAEERLRADKAEHEVAVLRERLTDAESANRMDRDVFEVIKTIARHWNIDHTRDPQWVVKEIWRCVQDVVDEDELHDPEDCDQTVAELQQSNSALKERITHLETSERALKDEVASQRQKNHELTGQLWSQENPSSFTERDVQHLRKRAVKAEETVEELMSEKGGYLDALNAKDADLARKEEGLQRQSDKILRLEAQARATRGTLTSRELEIGQARQEISRLRRARECPNPEVHAKVMSAEKKAAEYGTAAVALKQQVDTALEIIRLQEVARTALVNYHQSRENLARSRESARVQERAQAAYFKEMGEVDEEARKKHRELLALREAKTDGS